VGHSDLTYRVRVLGFNTLVALPFDPYAPHFRWFQSWRKRIAMAKIEPDKADAWSHLAMVSQMRYVTLAAIAIVKENANGR
jgi:hypothetical protein